MRQWMELNLFVNDDKMQPVPVIALPMSTKDAEQTEHDPKWQTSWLSSFIKDRRKMKFALKTLNGELIGLAAYEIRKQDLVVYIAYMESQPESNPVLTHKAQRRYTGIGKALVANGIALSFNHEFGGAVTLEAKTPELEKHYIRDFGAVRLPSFGGAARLLIPEETSYRLIAPYLIQDENEGGKAHGN